MLALNLMYGYVAEVNFFVRQGDLGAPRRYEESLTYVGIITILNIDNVNVVFIVS